MIITETTIKIIKWLIVLTKQNILPESTHEVND